MSDVWNPEWDDPAKREHLLRVDLVSGSDTASRDALALAFLELRKAVDVDAADRPLKNPSPRQMAARAWYEYMDKTNPYPVDSVDFREWRAEMEYLEISSGAWEGYPPFKLPRVTSEISKRIDRAHESPRELGIASLLIGIWWEECPFQQGSWAHEDWIEGWLKGVWIKGHLAARFGKPKDYLNMVRSNVEARVGSGAFADSTPAATAWIEGWYSARLSMIHDKAKTAGTEGAKAAVPPGLDAREAECWQSAFEEGALLRRQRIAEGTARWAVEMGGSVAACEFEEGSPEREWWLAEHARYRRELARDWELLQLESEDDSGSSIPLLLAADRPRQSGLDARLRGDSRESNPYRQGSSDAQWWEIEWDEAEERIRERSEGSWVVDG